MGLRKSEDVEVLSDWLDCWFGDSKTTGYISITDLNFQKFYGAKDLKALRSDTEGVQQRYISLNGFTFGSRKSVNLKQLRNIGIDLDQYKLGMSIEQGLDELQALILDGIIPEPNLVLTSRGIQLFYTIAGGASPEVAWLTSYITEQLISKMKHIGADSNAKDLARVMRVPNSVNERNNSIVTPDIWNPIPYTLQELQTFCKPLEKFETRSKKKSSVVRIKPKGTADNALSFFYRTNNARLVDLDKLITIRNGDFTHQRNVFLYAYAYHQSLLVNNFSDLEYFMQQVLERIHSRDKKKLSKAEFNRTIKSAYNDAKAFFEYLKDNSFKITNTLNDGIIKPFRTETLISKLEITEDEQRQLTRLHTGIVSKEKDAERKMHERREKGVKERSQYDSTRKDSTHNKLEQLRAILESNPNVTHKVLANTLEVSTKTIQRLKKQL